MRRLLAGCRAPSSFALDAAPPSPAHRVRAPVETPPPRRRSAGLRHRRSSGPGRGRRLGSAPTWPSSPSPRRRRVAPRSGGGSGRPRGLSVSASRTSGFYREGLHLPDRGDPERGRRRSSTARRRAHYVIDDLRLPLAAALLSSVFCSGVCPSGRSRSSSRPRGSRFRRAGPALGSLKWAYLALALYVRRAPAAERDFLICRFDPSWGFPLHRRRLDAGARRGVLLAGGFGAGPTALALPVRRAPQRLLAVRPGAASRSRRTASSTAASAVACPYGAIEDNRACAPPASPAAGCYSNCPVPPRRVRRAARGGRPRTMTPEAQLVVSRRLGVGSAVVALVATFGLAGDTRPPCGAGRARRAGSGASRRRSRRTPGPRPPPRGAQAADDRSLGRDRRRRPRLGAARVGRPPRGVGAVAPVAAASTAAFAGGAGGGAVRATAARSREDGAAGVGVASEEAGVDLSFVDDLVERLGRGPEAAVPILQAIQEHYRYLPDEALRRVCELTEITPAQIAGRPASTPASAGRRSGHVVKSATAPLPCGGRAAGPRRAAAPPWHPARRRHRRATALHARGLACLGCCSLARCS